MSEREPRTENRNENKQHYILWTTSTCMYVLL